MAIFTNIFHCIRIRLLGFLPHTDFLIGFMFCVLYFAQLPVLASSPSYHKQTLLSHLQTQQSRECDSVLRVLGWHAQGSVLKPQHYKTMTCHGNCMQGDKDPFKPHRFT